MELCYLCRKPILKCDLVWRDVQTLPATHYSPAEWDMHPFHADCANQPEPDLAYERAAARFWPEGEDDWF